MKTEFGYVLTEFTFESFHFRSERGLKISQIAFSGNIPEDRPVDQLD